MSRMDVVEAQPRATTTADDASQAIPAWLTRPVVVLPLILLAVVALYAPSMNDWFQTDDLLLLRAARVVPFWTYVREAFDFTDFEPLHFYAYRPLYFISSDVLYVVFGLHPVPYHITVLTFHLVNVVLTFHVARKLTGSVWIGYGAAAIFGLHPVYLISVAWISGLNSVVATTGQLACTALLLAHDERRRWYLLAGALVAYGLALAFHQEIFVAPAVVLAYIVVRQPQWHRSLLTPRVIVPFALFGMTLLAFLAIQGQASQEAGFLDDFLPSSGTLRLIAGTLAISVAPTGGAGFGLQHDLIAVAVVAVLGLAAWQAGSLRLVLLFAIAWYVSLLALSILFFDEFPVRYLQGAFVRKTYAAGPAIGLIGAIVIAVVWRRAERHLHPSLIAALAGVGLVGVVAFAFVRANDQHEAFQRAGHETRLFYEALSTAHSSLPEGGTLYVAGAPFSLVFLNCQDEPTNLPALLNGPSTLCYLDNLAAVIYERDVAVQIVTPTQAQDPAFLSELGPDDRVLCYRC